MIKVGPGASGTRATGRERDTFFLWAKLLPRSSRALRETVGSTGGVPLSHRAFGQPCPRGSGRLSPWPAGHPGGHLLSARQRAASSGVRFPEATDLLGALRLSGYACGARVMAAVRGAAAKTKRSTRTAAAPRSEGSRSLHAAPQSITRPEHSSPARGPVRPGPAPGARSPEVPCLPTLVPSPPGDRQPSTARRVRARVPACVFPRATAGAQGRGALGPPPATYRPPCPAPSSRALRVQPQLDSAGRRAPIPGALRRGGRSSGSERTLITRLSGS